MASVREGLPDGRYGRTADQRADRKLKIIGSVLGVALLGLVGWAGGSYIAGQDLSGRVVSWKVVSAEAVDVHLEVIKDKGAKGVCTIRSQSEDGGEVGRKDITVDAARGQVDTVERMRTTGRANTVELIGCTATSR